MNKKEVFGLELSCDPAALTPAAARAAIRRGEITGPTTGFCAGYAQGNLVVLPKAWPGTFCCSASATPRPARCWRWPTPGARTFAQFAPGSDIAADIPRYRVYEHGRLTAEPTDVTAYFDARQDWSAF